MKPFRALLLVCIGSAALQAQAQLFLWKAEKDGHSAWLLGSIHAGRADFYPMPKPVEDAYAQASTLVVEADVSDKAAVVPYLSKAVLPAPHTVRELLSAERQKHLDQTLAHVGMPRESADRMKPWFLVMTLEAAEMQRLGFDAAEGIDLHYLGKAKQDGKKVVELESVKSQFTLFDDMPQADTLAMLDNTMDEVNDDRFKQEIDAMATAWKQGDVPAMRKVIEDEGGDSPAMKRINDKLFAERNRAMTDKIVDLANSPAPFIVVGAGHLAGPDNLIEMLRLRGFHVTQY